MIVYEAKVGIKDGAHIPGEKLNSIEFASEVDEDDLASEEEDIQHRRHLRNFLTR